MGLVGELISLRYIDGRVYKGGFKNDKPHGKGEFLGKDKNTIHGVWERGQLVREL